MEWTPPSETASMCQSGSESKHDHHRRRRHHERANLAKVRDLLHVAPKLDTPSDDTVIETRPTFICRHCGAPMIVIDILQRTAPIRAPPISRSAT